MEKLNLERVQDTPKTLPDLPGWILGQNIEVNNKSKVRQLIVTISYVYTDALVHTQEILLCVHKRSLVYTQEMLTSCRFFLISIC